MVKEDYDGTFNPWPNQRYDKEIKVDGEVLGLARRTVAHGQKGWCCFDRNGKIVDWWLVDLGTCVRRLCRLNNKTVPKDYRVSGLKEES